MSQQTLGLSFSVPHAERTTGVKPRRTPEGERGIPRAVPNRKTREDREGGRREEALEHLFGAHTFAWMTLVEVAEDDACDPREDPVKAKRGEEPVDAVGALSDVFEK